jgi:organic radical activating enzyme
MIKVMHVLLTYRCSLRCEHCYVHGSPRARGTFTISQVGALLREAARLPGLEWIIFEGGEPFLRYQLLLQSIQRARQFAFKVGVITNGYFGRDETTAARFLEPLHQLGVQRLWVSDDAFHYNQSGDTPAQRTRRAAQRIGLSTGQLCIQFPEKVSAGISSQAADEQLPFDQQLRFRGRAAENLTGGRLKQPWDRLTSCPLDPLKQPIRVQVDSHGNVQLCQGLSLGVAWDTPLSTLIAEFQPERHPILGALQQGGPSFLAQRYGIEPEGLFADACNLCYRVRQALVDRFPRYLAPRQVYGL